MRFSTITFQVAAVVIGVVSSARGESKDKRQISTNVDGGIAAAESTDSHVSATGFAGAVAAGSKYFQYTHVPAKDHYEHGHKRGNEHHFIERHEKAHPHAGEFKTKVRWGDKHGGYGEHYWDYNHDGHDHDGEGGETTQQEQYVPAPSNPQYREAEAPEKSPVFGYSRRKRTPAAGAYRDDVEFIDNRARHLVLSGLTGKHGGNYRRAPAYDRAKRGDNLRVVQSGYVPFNGRVVDQKTGIAYEFRPVAY